MIPGIDISFYQASEGITPRRFFNPVIAREKGVKFAFLKSSERLGKDNAVDEFAKTFAAAGIPFGCYHYARPDPTASAKAQAEKCWSFIKDFKTSLPPALDLEASQHSSGVSLGMSWIKVWLETMRDLCGKNPIIYTRAGFWNAISKSNETVSKWALDYPLWVANYYKSAIPFPAYHIPDIVEETTTMPLIPDLWKNNGLSWSFWQYTALGDGEFYGGNYAPGENKTGLDLNVFNGSQEELNSLLQVQEAEPVAVAELVTEPVTELVTEPVAELVEAVEVVEAVEAVAALHALIKRRAPVAFGCGFRSLSVSLRSTSHAPCQTLPAGRVRSTATRQALLLSVQPQRSGRERGNALKAQGRGASQSAHPRPFRAYPLKTPRLRSAPQGRSAKIPEMRRLPVASMQRICSAPLCISRAQKAGLSFVTMRTSALWRHAQSEAWGLPKLSGIQPLSCRGMPAFEALRKSGTRRSPKLSGIQPLSCRGQLKFSHNALISESIGAFPQRR